MKPPLLLGHRGVRIRGLERLTAGVPAENSLEAFEYALAQGCDGFEFDVRYTRDGRNVLWHDPECHGLTIANTDFADLCERSESRLATLEDVLRQFGSRSYLDIELKVSGGEELILAALHVAVPQSGVLVSSFLPDVLRRMRVLSPDIPLGYICDRSDRVPAWKTLPIQVLLPHYTLGPPELIREVHGHGLRIMTWTVNDAARMRQLAEWGVDGIISDDPALLYQTFHSEHDSLA